MSVVDIILIMYENLVFTQYRRKYSEASQISKVQVPQPQQLGHSLPLTSRLQWLRAEASWVLHL